MVGWIGALAGAGALAGGLGSMFEGQNQRELIRKLEKLLFNMQRQNLMA